MRASATTQTGMTLGEVDFFGPANGNPGSIFVSSAPFSSTLAIYYVNSDSLTNIQFTASGATASFSAPDPNVPGFTDTDTLSITLGSSGGGGTLTISPSQLAPATVGQPYTPLQFLVSGGTPPYTGVFSCNLPPGMQFKLWNTGRHTNCCRNVLTQQLSPINSTVSAGGNVAAMAALSNFMNFVSSSTGLTNDALNVLYYDAVYAASAR